jgi:DNA replication licensing factor MCM5
VLAAANPVFGRWNDTEGVSNVDLMPTLLSRFDMIFLVKDHHNQQMDINMAKHVINVHSGYGDIAGDIPFDLLKRYIHYCREHCAPRLDKDAAEKLCSRYVLMRSKSSTTIPITVRQLESIIRIAEGLAKLELKPLATEAHVTEALRLFEVSTIQATLSVTPSPDVEQTDAEVEMIFSIEKQLRSRLPYGSMVTEEIVLQQFKKQGFPDKIIRAAITDLLKRGELLYNKRMLCRVA